MFVISQMIRERVIREKALGIVSTFENNFILENPDYNCNSFWTKEMKMIQKEQLPLDLRIYCEWNPYCDRRLNNWYFFAPSHVFRLPNQSDYLIAQTPSEWLLFGNNEFKIVNVGKKDANPFKTSLFVETINRIINK